MENTVLKSDFGTLVDLFFCAKKQLVLSVPNLQVELAEALVGLQGKGVNIAVFLEFSEEVYRQGYGEIEALNILTRNNIEIINKQGFNIYFIMYDDHGFFYFPKSFFFEKEGTAYDLVPMMEKQVNMMKVLFGLYFESDNEQIQKVIQEVGLDTINHISKNFTHLSDNETKQVSEKLLADPVRKPELTRRLEVYKSKFQIIELEFNGANLSSKKVKLPKGALPFNDKDLIESIESSIKLFDGGKNNDFLKPFIDLNKEVEKIRKDFLYRLKSRDKSIIKRDTLGQFKKRIAEVVKKIKELNEKLSNELQAEIVATRKKIKENLLEFLLANPPEVYKHYKDDVLMAEISNDVNQIVSGIQFPKAHEILEKMNITIRPYDLTWEDLNDEEVLNEMVGYQLITQDEKAYFEQTVIETEPLDQQLYLFKK